MVKLFYFFSNHTPFVSIKTFYEKYFNNIVSKIEEEHEILTDLINIKCIEDQKEYMANMSRLKRKPLELLKLKRPSTIDVTSTESIRRTPRRSSRPIVRDYSDPRFSRNISNYDDKILKTVEDCEKSERSIELLQLSADYLESFLYDEISKSLLVTHIFKSLQNSCKQYQNFPNS